MMYDIVAVVSLRTLLQVLLHIEILLLIHSSRGPCVADAERKAINLPSPVEDDQAGHKNDV